MRIAIFGAGQLAMMMIQSDKNNEHQFIVIDPADNPPASHFAEHIKTQYTDKDTLKNISETCDVATIDFENVDVSTIKFLEEKIPTYPNSKALEVCQHRLEEKNFLRSLDIPTTEYRCLADQSIIDNLPLKEKLKDPNNKYIAKTVRFGYDGKGQSKITQNNINEFVHKSLTDVEYILEKVVEFKSEVSLICVRTCNGKSLFYPLIENHHHEGILHTSRYPNEFEKLQKDAEYIGLKVLNKLNYVGVLVIEFFVDKNSKLIVNEMAPRVHNSGHWTIEGSNLSQFKAHIDAITGKVDLEMNEFKPSLMMNILSKHKSEKDFDEKYLTNANVYLHDYYKEERQNRKLGHITLIFNDEKSFIKDSENFLNIT
tara:strand:+ start:12278 stop:13387 length:1110 start_codon:yes stop_codon:yes gene_type:complete